MTATGLKARPGSGNPPRDTFCIQALPVTKRLTLLFPECEPDRPPRLCRGDLKDPERFHQRLIDYLMRQR